MLLAMGSWRHNFGTPFADKKNQTMIKKKLG
jgi:hypothetical protein